jgi:uncharacterized protein (TIGR00369 family)
VLLVPTIRRSRATIARMSGFDTEQLHRLVPFSAELGIRVVSAAPAAVRLELYWQARLCTAGGVLHGGALMSLADTAGAVSAFLNLPDGAQGTTTVESKTNLIGAVREGTVTALATPLHTGRTLIVVETELRNSRGTLVAKTMQTQAVLQPQPTSG